MSTEALQSIVRKIINELACGNYERLVEGVCKSRLTSEDLRGVVRDYGRTLEMPPSEAYDKLDAIRVKGVTVPTWSIRVPLWTREEGRSDLTLELTISFTTPEPIIELNDLRVL